MTRAFISYSHADDALRAEFNKHLSLLRRQGLLELWSDHRIPAGGEFDKHISAELEAADIIILLISPDFMASDYCYGIEMKRAMERHQAGSAVVVPVILRPVDWHSAPFGALKALPRDGKPVVKWPTLDDAFLDVVQALRSLLATRSASTTQMAISPAPASKEPSEASAIAPSRPRSGTLALACEFKDIDRDSFLDEAFAYIRAYFENSLQDVGERNPGIAGKLRRISEVGFTATLYRDGSKLAGCYIRISNGFGRDRSIGYSGNDSAQDNSYNEMLSVEADRHTLHLEPMMGNWSGSPSKFTHEGAAEQLWQLFVEHLT
ncbi:toll/interleukin-1 receptor domain-containing protein [Alicycliphilus sp. T452]|jgi:hypothetical protein